MRILDAKVQWPLGWANSPSLQILAEKPVHTPWSQERYKFKQIGAKPDHGLYVAVSSEVVDHYSYRGPDQGYGGRTFHVTLEDGTERDLKGPWDAGASYINKHFGPEIVCVGVSLTDEPAVLQKGYTFWHAYILIEAAQRAVEQFLPHAELVPMRSHAGIGMTSDDQSAIVAHGSDKPYGSWSEMWVVQLKGGGWPSYSQALEYGDVVHESHGFRLRRTELGLDTLEDQAVFNQFWNNWKKVQKRERYPSGAVKYMRFEEEWAMVKEAWFGHQKANH